MPWVLELGETYVEIDLTDPWYDFNQDEKQRRQTWSLGAQLSAWLGLTAVLVALLVFGFFYSVDARTFETCVSSMVVEIGKEPVINPVTCFP